MRARGLLAAVALALAVAGSGCAQPEDEEVVRLSMVEGGERWREIAATLGGPEDPDSPNVCNRGEPECIEEVVREMTRRFDRLAAACDHRAAFAFMYLQVTEGVGDEPARFDNEGYLNHLDAVFAQQYFSAYDNYVAGNLDDVPVAWRVAFQSAEREQVTGLGDMLVGMNAHISRDLPFALADIGLETASGESAKPDYDAVNALLADVQEPMLAAASERLDPTVGRFRVPAFDFGSEEVAGLLATWRSEAYRNAEALIEAPTPAARREVAATIERDAESRGRTLAAATSYALTGGSAEDRRAFCESRPGRGTREPG